MSDTPKQRRFWQIHLSTAILVSLITATFIHFNLSVREEVVMRQGAPHPVESADMAYKNEDHVRWRAFGWPCWCVTATDYVRSKEGNWSSMTAMALKIRAGERLGPWFAHPTYSYLIFNAVLFVLLLITSVIGFEYLLRDKAAKR